MKKKLTRIIVAVALSCTLLSVTIVLLFTKHEHKYSNAWSYNDDYHWRNATCKHTDKKTDEAFHTFGDGTEVDDGTEFVCSVCSFKKITASKYRVTDTEFANALENANNFRLDFSDGSEKKLYLISDVCYFEASEVSEYLSCEGTEYFYYQENEEDGDYLKTSISKSEYSYFKEDVSLFPYIKNCFSNLSYDKTNKAYVGEIEIPDEYTSLALKNLSVFFENGKLKKLNATLVVGSGESVKKSNYVYSDFDNVSVNLPTNIHNHTFSDVLSYNSLEHYYASTCGHYEFKDKEKHAISENGLCTVCGFSILQFSDDGKTLEGVNSEYKDITSLTIPDGITAIANDVFFNFTKLTDVTIPNGVTSLGACAFAQCVNLTSVSLPNGLTYIGDRAFEYCEKLTDIIIPSTVTELGLRVFYNCHGLTSVVLPDSITIIGVRLFDECTSLTYVKMSSGLSEIIGNAFGECVNLSTIVISEGTTRINDYAFSECTGLKTVIIPKSLTAIKNYAFRNSSLETILFNGNATEWGSIDIEQNALELINLANVYYYSETEPEEAGKFWRYVNGEPTKW